MIPAVKYSQDHKYLDNDTIFIMLALYTTTMEGFGPSKEEERRESAAADADFFLFEKKVFSSYY